MEAKAKGVKIGIAGRLGGAEIAHPEEYKEGQIPLHTLRADIDFARATAFTTYGTVGIKVWIYRGDIRGGMQEFWEKSLKEEQEKERRTRPGAGGRGGGRRGGGGGGRRRR